MRHFMTDRMAMDPQRQFYFGTKFGCVKNHKLFITAFKTVHCVKLTWPVEPILSTSTLLVGALPGEAGW